MSDHHAHNTLANAWVSALGRCPSQIAFEDGDKTFTYSATADLIARMTRVMGDGGGLFGKGVGVLSMNRADGFMAAVGAQIAGGYFVALPNRSSANDIADICDDAKLDVLVVDPALDDLAADVLSKVSVVPSVFSLGPSSLGRNLLALAEAIGATRLTVAPEVTWQTDSHIMFTGGTTGRSKGVVHLQRGALGMALRPLMAYDLPTKPRSLAIAPMTHSGYQTPLSTIMAGGTVVVVPAFAPDVFVDTVERKHINATVGVPTMIYAVLDHTEQRGCDFSSMQHWLYAASPISPDRLAEAQRRWGSIFVQAYAQTESYGAGTVLLADEHDLDRPERLASCGRPTPDTTLRVVDDAGNEVPSGEVGEIVMRSPYLMDRYVNQPELTEEVFADGWLHTGDMAVVDDDGFCTIVDRKKDMIISGGYNVYSREVEDALMEHPSVRAAAVVGVPDDRWGEAVKAFVVVRDNAPFDEAALIAYVKDRKGGVKSPKSVELVSTLPLTAVGKIDKKLLRAPFWADR